MGKSTATDWFAKWTEGKDTNVGYFEFDDGLGGIGGKKTFKVKYEPKGWEDEWAKAKPIIEGKMDEAFKIAKEHRTRNLAGYPDYKESTEELNKELIPGLNEELKDAGFSVEMYYYKETIAHGGKFVQIKPHYIVRVKRE